MGERHISAGICAACKHQLAENARTTAICLPTSPPNKTQQFKTVHKVYGVSNLLKLVRANETLPARQRAVAALTWEAEWREKEPAEGCYKEVMMLRCEIQRLREILARCHCERPLDLDGCYWGVSKGVFLLKNNQV